MEEAADAVGTNNSRKTCGAGREVPFNVVGDRREPVDGQADEVRAENNLEHARPVLEDAPVPDDMDGVALSCTGGVPLDVEGIRARRVQILTARVSAEGDCVQLFLRGYGGAQSTIVD